MYEALKARAFRERRSIAELVRESLTAHLQDSPPRAIGEFSFVGAGSSRTDRRDKTSEAHDRALAVAFASRRSKRK